MHILASNTNPLTVSVNDDYFALTENLVEDADTTGESSHLSESSSPTVYRKRARTPTALDIWAVMDRNIVVSERSFTAEPNSEPRDFKMSAPLRESNDAEPDHDKPRNKGATDRELCDSDLA
ncbi:uncharacterized protein TRIVIDRAFT_218088 [Trichoderma virens Gv29-8]|uniref:Uncharacterized protein n=1 Tax=Hypocrea virens (strain Gv29-8 / FGSC 10586) TaxID=413071 RepID=G9MGS1_HYPVG|nr:uncharacterized protein TRIVIDRAFT_218088 [Trichoderma virens Gv29-8]EHK25916.1 hypothetical protein TRIVIDRAFT_218088 [Trichoderma virens Gv29-8]UKZ46093.1 hypothetical protein TrVGV298_000291 [Trichoderma virens]